MSETGAVKFACEHVRTPLAAFADFQEMNSCRRQLLRLGVLGVDENGIGFGNLSVREPGTSNFYITGSATGAKAELTLDDYARVIGWDLASNCVRCEGGTIASSESLTHAAIYDAEATVKAVIHGHSANLWSRWAGVVTTTRHEIEYGTPEMAKEVRRLFETKDLREQKMFVMGGHEGGFVTFGADLPEALAVLREAMLR